MNKVLQYQYQYQNMNYIQEKPEVTQKRDLFWNHMNLIAIQNASVQMLHNA